MPDPSTSDRLMRSGSIHNPNFSPSECAYSVSGFNPFGKRAGSGCHDPRPLSKSIEPSVPAPVYQPASTTNSSTPSAAARSISSRMSASSMSVPYANHVL